MKKTKLFTVMLTGLLALPLLAGQATAQTGEPTQGKPEMMRQGKGAWQPDPSRHIEKLTKRLGLTAEQQAKIKPILDEEAAQLKAIDDEKLTRAERRTRMQGLHNATFEKIRPLLTSEQQKKHDDMKARMMKQGDAPK